MLTIRNVQFTALSLGAIVRLEDKIIRHATKHFPDECSRLGPARLREAIRNGIERATGYGILSEREICKYVNIMFVFGHDFDEPTKCPWASVILQYKDPKGFVPKIDLLMERASEHSSEAIGILRSLGLE